MASLTRVLTLLASLAVSCAPLSASAQFHPDMRNMRIRLNNPTLQCVWVTLYEKGFTPQIIHGRRDETGPLMVQASRGYTFIIPRMEWFRLRAQPKYMCANGGGHNMGDTQFTISRWSPGYGPTSMYEFTLHKDRMSNHYWLTMHCAGCRQ